MGRCSRSLERELSPSWALCGGRKEKQGKRPLDIPRLRAIIVRRVQGKGRTKGYTTTGVSLSCGLFAAKGGDGLVKINGEALDLAGRVLADYLAGAGYSLSRVAVERNGEIIPKRLYGETVLADGDALEIVGFVGGG